MSPRWQSRLARLCVAALVLWPAAAPAQSVRISGSSTLRYLELRPLVRDSVPVEGTRGTGLLRQTESGRVVRCVPGEPYCRDTRPGEVTSVVPAVQDLEVSVWGLAPGVRLLAQLRARTAWGGTPDLWPRADEPLEILAGYAEWNRERVRVRLGRQWQLSGLGFYNFDGAAVDLRAHSAVNLQAYAGRSLMRGLNEPRTSPVVASLDPELPVEPGLLLGVQGRYRRGTRLAASAAYQVDVRQDRLGLYSELALADAVLRLGGHSVTARLETDVASGALNEARVHLRTPPVRRAVVEAELRRYRPYFELWTIWGAFSPVGFDEARTVAAWQPSTRGPLIRAEAAYRQYAAAAGEEPDAFRGNGWVLGATADWSPAHGWRLESAYRATLGFGAAGRDVELALAHHHGELFSLGVHAVAFRRLYEFRLDEGEVVGLGGEGTLRLSPRTRAAAGLAAYRHLGVEPEHSLDWSQLRGSLRLNWVVGSEPGAPRGERRTR
jgi:hypothetical protein